MTRQSSPQDYRRRLNAVLTELALYAKGLCPEAEVEVSVLQYEDEDGRVEVFPPGGYSEAEEEQMEQARGERAAALLAETGFYVLCAALDVTVRPPEPFTPHQ